MHLFKNKNLITYRLEIYGMACGSCEAHVNNIIRKNFNVKSVKSNHFKNITIIQSEEELDTNKIKEVIASTGYELKEIERVILHA